MSSTEGDLVLRPAVPDDAAAVAGVLLSSRRAALAHMPAPVHDEAEQTAHLRGLLADGEVWLAEAGQRAVGFAALRGDWLEMLYVAPERTGTGVGSALIDLVKHARPEGFSLWVFETNRPARGFYRRHGLVELERTDGSGNEERAPDIRVAWCGGDPVAFLRRQVDEVDDELAEVVARRVALTCEIQRRKPVAGHAGRDARRELEIARRLARRAPALSEEEWRRIAHEVISVGLDAAARRSHGADGAAGRTGRTGDHEEAT